jgi:magnesium transporter
MAIRKITQGNLTWINIDRVDEEALTYLKENHNFHHLDIEDIRSESQTPKIDTYKNYLFIVLHVPHWQGSSKTIVPLEVDCFIGEDFLITIQHSKVKEMTNFFYKCMKNRKTKKEWMSETSGFLFYHLLEALFFTSRSTLNNIGKQISKVENNIFAGEQDTRVVKELAVHRRNVLSFRRIIDPQRYVIANLAHMRKPFLDETMSIYFDNVVDYLNKLWAILDTYKDTVNGLHVTVESLMTQRTNKVVGTLTAISVGLLPLTLLSGIYGMNISGLPFENNPILVWSMFGVLALVIILIILVMKRKQWL